MPRSRKIGEVIYYVTKSPDGLREKMERFELPGEHIEQIWDEEEVPDVYFVNGTLVVDLNFMDERTLLAVKKTTVAVVADGETELLKWIRNA
ncbi:TPA: hypothetical protein EYP13_03315, partial [Candidatus Micrarchaeota archaeon]|nr:hypothetical protein [Candidatus Micrarchaeota archaeon]